MKARILILVLILTAAPLPAGAVKDLVVDLSKSVVAITTGFTGSDLLLFGVIEGEGDVVVAVRGPQHDEIVRHKERIAGVWVNRDEMVFEQAPGYYAIASNRPITEFISEEFQKRYQIGAANLELRQTGWQSEEKA